MGLFSWLFGSNAEEEEEIGSYRASTISAWQAEAEDEKRARMEENQEVEDYIITSSFFDNLPYPCFFDSEEDMVKKIIKSKCDREKIINMRHCAWDYVLHLDNPRLRPFNLKKGQYWVDRIINEAKKGNLFAKAAVVSIHYQEKYSALNIIEVENNYLSFQKEIISRSNSGEKEAQYAEAFYIDYYIYPENFEGIKEDLYKKSAAQGYSASYLELYHQTKDTKKREDLAIKGAECDDGPDAAWFQQHLADAYYYGECGHQQDQKLGIYWAKRAAANGYNMAHILGQ